jgi:hypothetical protein
VAEQSDEQLELLRKALGIRPPDGEKYLVGPNSQVLGGIPKSAVEAELEEQQALSKLKDKGDEPYRRWLRKVSGGRRG